MHTLEAQPRTKSGTRVAIAERAAGLLPITLYGAGGGTDHFTISTHEFEGLVRHNEQVFDLALPDGKQRVMVREVQWDYMGDKLVHVDCLRVVKGQKMEFTVSIEMIGHAKGLLKGEMTIQMKEMVIVCIPKFVPESLLVNVTELDVDETITAGDIEMPEGVELVGDPEAIVFAIHPRREEEEEEEVVEEGDESAEPEVINKGKAEDEGDKPADE